MGTIARYRLVVVLLTAALLATLTVVLTGGDRADAIDGPVDLVYVATGRNFPDALAGSTLAAAYDAPLLTVEPDLPLPPGTIAALEGLRPDRIIVLGGPGAVSTDVLQALATYARSGDVDRIQGNDRHETAAAIADALPEAAGLIDADLLDGLDATAFQRAGETVTVTRRTTCGPNELALSDDRSVVVNDEFTYLRAGSLENFAAVTCELWVPPGATITALGYSGRDDDPDGRLSCQRMAVLDSSTTPPVRLGEFDPDPNSSDTFLTTGPNSARPGEVEMATGLNDGPVTAGPQTHASILCYLSGSGGNPNLRLYSFFVEYTLEEYQPAP